MTRVALLWHMHQPYYEDLVTGEHILPWVRLHALKDYFGMVALFREFPEMRATFNLVPSLLAQIQAFADDRARDPHLEVGLKPATALTGAETAFLRRHFFSAQREHMIAPLPRYVELLDQRERGAGFQVQDLLDLQVLHKLAWIDPLYLDADSRVQALVAKTRGFSEEDKRKLHEVELEILRRVIPEYREAAARGQIEISASPFYHPILPLLCDTDVYRRTHPNSPMPRVRFRHPEDAAEQLRSAAAYHERLFGAPPVGLWPSEGSVSDAMVPLVADAGFRWMATDELVLARSLGMDLTRNGQGHLNQPELLYAPWKVEAGGRSVFCAFRDHTLSDLIGFTYAHWSAEAAADDFCARLVEAGRSYAERTGGGEATIPVILDGENAWEHFPGGGRPFLRALYRRLTTTPGLRTVTMSEACREPARTLGGIFPGSWINADFYIWIGHADDHVAWTQLAEARAALESAGDVDASARDRARQELLIAEGSDWFWWYGDDHSSADDAAFDDLFRRHLRNVYELLGRPVPNDLFVSNISTFQQAGLQTDPSDLVTPKIDGEETSYFEWLGAGSFDCGEPAGAMHEIDPRPAELTRILFGFDGERFHLRLDGRRPLSDLLAGGARIVLRFLAPASRSIDLAPGASSAGSPTAAGTILETSMPLSALGAAPGAMLSFIVSLEDARGNEIERHPVSRPIDVRVPASDFAARNWSA